MLLAGTMAFGQQSIMTCSSDDGQTKTCQAGPNRGIQFLRQRSQASCVEGQSYGIQRNRVWVSGGCRADFQVFNRYNNNSDGTYSRQGTYDDDIYSQDRDHDNDADDQGRARRRRHHRDRNGNVFDDDDNNGTYRDRTYNDGTYNDPYGRQGTYGPYNNQDSTIGVYPGRGVDSDSGNLPQYYGRYSNGMSLCSSDQGSGQTYCQTGGAFSRVQMTRQNGRCAQGQTWGVSSYGLWVADGCVAEFSVQR
jgi:hypothetical protein